MHIDTETRCIAFARTWLVRAPLFLLLLALPASAVPSPDPFDVEAPAGVSEPERSPLAARVGAELGGGVLGGLSLGLTGALVGGLTSWALCGGSKGLGSNMKIIWDCPPAAAPIVLGGAGALGGVALGVTWGGRSVGGRGSFSGALAGIFLSLASGGLAYQLAAPDLGTALIVAAPLFSVAGYELSASSAASSPASLTVAPAISVGSGRTGLGLQGRF